MQSDGYFCTRTVVIAVRQFPTAIGWFRVFNIHIVLFQSNVLMVWMLMETSTPTLRPWGLIPSLWHLDMISPKSLELYILLVISVISSPGESSQIRFSAVIPLLLHPHSLNPSPSLSLDQNQSLQSSQVSKRSFNKAMTSR